MNRKSPLVIVSAFGRGNTLAQTLKSRDIPVHLLDVSNFLGETKVEDDEGPFGFFSQGLSPIENQRLMFDHPCVLQENGFTLMLPDGPLEFKSTLTNYRLERLGVPDKIWGWVTGSQLLLNSDHHTLLNDDFDKTWMYHLVRSLNSNQWVPNYRAGLVENGLSFSGDYYVRSVERNVSEEALQRIAKEGVQVDSKVEIIDAAMGSGRKLKSLEIKSPNSGTSVLIEFEQIVWFLSGEETEKLSPSLQEKIFPRGVLRPVGSWNRARIKITACPQRDSLPPHSAWIVNRALPWTHDNLFLLQRAATAELFDVWFRAPENFRFLKDYILKIIENISLVLERRLDLKPGSLQLNEAPLSTIKNSSELGPSRHPLFESRDLAETAAPDFKNMHWVASESISGLGWNFLIAKSRAVESQLQEWWKERERLREKAEQEARKLNSSNSAGKGADRD